MPLGARHQGIAAPDDPHPRPVLRRVRVLDGELHLLLDQLLDRPVNDLLVLFRPVCRGLFDQLARVAVELRVEG